MYVRSDSIKSKSAQLPKFTDAVLDLGAVNNIEKTYSYIRIPTTLLNQYDLETCFRSSKINDNIINIFVLEDRRWLQSGCLASLQEVSCRH